MRTCNPACAHVHLHIHSLPKTSDSLQKGCTLHCSASPGTSRWGLGQERRVLFAYVISSSCHQRSCAWTRECDTVHLSLGQPEQTNNGPLLLHFHRYVALSGTQTTLSQHELAHEPPVTIYMGRDKVESSYDSSLPCSSWTYSRAPDEDLIKYAWPQDVWFHVDKLSSAHVYLRLPESIASWEAIPDALLVDCAQLVKANSIEGES